MIYQLGIFKAFKVAATKTISKTSALENIKSPRSFFKTFGREMDLASKAWDEQKNTLKINADICADVLDSSTNQFNKTVFNISKDANQGSATLSLDALPVATLSTDNGEGFYLSMDDQEHYADHSESKELIAIRASEKLKEFPQILEYAQAQNEASWKRAITVSKSISYTAIAGVFLSLSFCNDDNSKEVEPPIEPEQKKTVPAPKIRSEEIPVQNLVLTSCEPSTFDV